MNIDRKVAAAEMEQVLFLRQFDVSLRRHTSTELADNEYSLSSQIRMDVEKLCNRLFKNRVRGRGQDHVTP